MEERGERELPWLRHVTHEMATLVLEHKDACKSRFVWGLCRDLIQPKRIDARL